MEDVLEVYQRPFDPLHPVVCIDEMNRQLVEEMRIPCKAGQPEKVDSEYVRKGVMDVFREYSATSNLLKYKQLGVKYGKIGAREMGKTAKKACTYGGGTDV